MSIKKGIVGFGISSVLAAGTGYAAHQWAKADHEATVTYDCGYQRNLVAADVCDGIDWSNNGISETQSVATAYETVAHLGMVAAGITAVVSFGVVMLGENDLSRRPRSHNIAVQVTHGSVEGPPPPDPTP